jgi:hypothetical protein
MKSLPVIIGFPSHLGFKNRSGRFQANWCLS